MGHKDTNKVIKGSKKPVKCKLSEDYSQTPKKLRSKRGHQNGGAQRSPIQGEKNNSKPDKVTHTSPMVNRSKNSAKLADPMAGTSNNNAVIVPNIGAKTRTRSKAI